MKPQDAPFLSWSHLMRFITVRNQIFYNKFTRCQLVQILYWSRRPIKCNKAVTKLDYYWNWFDFNIHIFILFQKKYYSPGEHAVRVVGR